MMGWGSIVNRNSFNSGCVAWCVRVNVPLSIFTLLTVFIFSAAMPAISVSSGAMSLLLTNTCIIVCPWIVKEIRSPLLTGKSVKLTTVDWVVAISQEGDFTGLISLEAIGSVKEGVDGWGGFGLSAFSGFRLTVFSGYCTLEKVSILASKSILTGRNTLLWITPVNNAWPGLLSRLMVCCP